MASSSAPTFNWDAADMKKKWEGFTKFGAATATEMTGKNFDKWLADAGVIDKQHITTTMTGIAFSKVAGPKKKCSFAETKSVLAAVAGDRARQSKRTQQEELDDIIAKLSQLEAPQIKSAAAASSDVGGVYSRLTDVSKYTGAHKLRFNEDGTGRGKAGREDVEAKDGYVGSYKHKGTYDKTHGKA